MRNDKLPMWTALANRLWWVSMGSRKGGDGEGGGWLPPPGAGGKEPAEQEAWAWERGGGGGRPLWGKAPG